MKTGLVVFEYDMFALWSMRSALESPLDLMNLEGIETPEVNVPAAAVWILILGEEMFFWNNEYPHGPTEGDPGVGGPLWEGQHGFCLERWKLWRSRFGELSVEGQLNGYLREICKNTEVRMAEIEADQSEIIAMQ